MLIDLIELLVLIFIGTLFLQLLKKLHSAGIYKDDE